MDEVGNAGKNPRIHGDTILVDQATATTKDVVPALEFEPAQLFIDNVLLYGIIGQ